MILLSILLFKILLILGVLHFYWAFGGQWGFAAALPTNEKGKPVLQPKPIHSIVVGLGLSAFALFYLCQTDLINCSLPDWATSWGGWIIPLVFIFRAIGDFRYVGFFKSVKGTDFAKLDAKYYVPLCLLIGILGYLIQWL